MSPLCQLEMTLPGGFPGGVGGDGSANERWGADAARGAARCGSDAIDDGGCGAAAGAGASSGVPAIEGLPDRGSNRLNLEATRSSQQPAQAGAATESGAGDRLPVVLGFWTDFGGREAARGSWDRCWPGNAAPMASAICRERVDLRLFPCGSRLSGGLGQAGGIHPNIDIICANSSPAKGRVERANKTLQDRLVKELRLAGVATLAEGNALLPRN